MSPRWEDRDLAGLALNEARATSEHIAYTHQDLVTLCDWMAGHGFAADDLANAVAKPWKYRDELRLAKAALEATS